MPLSPDIVAAVAERVAAVAGFDLPAWVVETRAAARIDALEIEPAAYVALIGAARGAGELDELLESLRVGETRLFRHRSQIEALVSAVAPALRAAGRRDVRVWSAGCSAGQEPYTLAAVLTRALPGCAISIAATDISDDALELARAASYPAAALDDVPAAWRDAFFVDGDRVCVRPELAALVRFERANLVGAAPVSEANIPYSRAPREAIDAGERPIGRASASAARAPRGCDLVWCRNVLIYFTPEARRLAIQRLVAALNPGGFLFVGYSESLRDIGELEAVRAGDAVFYRAARARAVERRTPPAGVIAAASGARLTPALGVPMPLIAADTHPGERPIDFDKDHTPPPMRIPASPPPEDVLIVRGHPNARALIAEVAARLAIAGLVRLVIDLDGCELLDDELAPVLRRARAAAELTGVSIELRTTRAGTRRWLARHALESS